MANATLYAVLERIQGQSLQAAYAQLTGQGIAPQNLDILQITVPGTVPGTVNANTPIVALNVDFTGAVHNPAVSPTDGTRLGVFHAIDQAAASTTAQMFASAFRWNVNQQLDILQVTNIGGNISYWLDFLGVAHGS